jgi:outer membrane receptor protein involved in Fe transport
VDSYSSGFRLDTSWGKDGDPCLTLGVDLRYLAQELNEIASGRIGFVQFTDANSPLPRSDWANPGIFAEQTVPVGERLKITGGGRVDFGESRVIDDPEKLAHLGNMPPDQQSSLADILGSSDFDRDFWLWSLYLVGDYELTPEWHLLAGTGYAQRPPSLTELYVAQSFMFLLQNGMNTVTGDPQLRPEQLLQGDLGLACNYDSFRGSVRGFYAWGFDYITFENLRVLRGPPYGNVEQVSIKYVNTPLATLSGFELLGEYDLHPWWTPFASVKYVEGTDRTRNGHFATKRVEPGVPSTRDYTKSRGYYSGVTGPAVEPLPGIYPLESRLGIRLHPPAPKQRWTIEFSARVVADQERVAASLLESPTPGFTVYDLRTYWRPNDRWLLLAGVENLTNKFYREHLDYRSQDGQATFQPGVNFYFGSELTY